MATVTAGAGSGAGAGDDSGAAVSTMASGMDALVLEAMNYAAAHGILSRRKDGVSMAPVPVTLTPYPIPRAAYTTAQSLRSAFAKLVDASSRDSEFIHEHVDGVAAADPDFSGRLLKIFDAVQAEGVAQPAALGILRSDYMLDSSSGRLLQIELNTISSSFGPLCENVQKLHQFMLSRYSEELKPFIDVPSAISFHDGKGTAKLAAGLAAAYNVAKKENSVIVIVALPGESNALDRWVLQENLWAKHGIKSVLRTLSELSEGCSLDEESRDLTLASGQHVAVAYFRAGYDPGHYGGEGEWASRLRIERSNAVKCPSIGYHIIGMKKVQQVFALPGTVERFLGEEEASLVRTCFAGLYNLDADAETTPGEVADIIAKASKQPEKYVLKPQREGGSHNFYGPDVKAKLQSLSPDELSQFILMERIFPAEQPALFLREGKCEKANGVAELGIFGTVLGNGKELLLDEAAGHLLRVKRLGVDEGGVAAGYAMLSSPGLV